MGNGRIGTRLVLASLLSGLACAGGSGGPDAGTDAPQAIEVAEVSVEVALDVAGDEVAPTPTWCPPPQAPAAPTGLLPEPWRFEELGEPLALAAISIEGADAAAADEARAIAARAGVPFQDGGGWTLRIGDAAGWVARKAACATLADLPAGGYYLQTGIDGAVV